jgi:hypothetical protein
MNGPFAGVVFPLMKQNCAARNYCTWLKSAGAPVMLEAARDSCSLTPARLLSACYPEKLRGVEALRFLRDDELLAP